MASGEQRVDCSRAYSNRAEWSVSVFTARGGKASTQNRSLTCSFCQSHSSSFLLPTSAAKGMHDIHYERKARSNKKANRKYEVSTNGSKLDPHWKPLDPLHSGSVRTSVRICGHFFLTRKNAQIWSWSQLSIFMERCFVIMAGYGNANSER